jgi:hypothetical protein
MQASTRKGLNWDKRTGTPRDEGASRLVSKAHGRYSASGQRKLDTDLPKGPAGAHGSPPKPGNGRRNTVKTVPPK